MPKPKDAKSNAKSATLESWEAGEFPTWSFWGKTTVHAYNTGNTPVTVSIQSGMAQAAYVFLDVGEEHREYGYWWGVPVTITNATQRDTANNQNPQIEAWVW